MARSTRAVISARGRRKCECTAMPTTSSSASASSAMSSVPSLRMFTSAPFKTRKPSRRALSASIAAPCLRSFASSAPEVIARSRVWSVIAMYWSPRRCAASAIASSVSAPSVHVVCVCKSPRKEPCSISCGRRPARAASISPTSSRSSGAMNGRSSAAYTSSSVLPAIDVSPRKTPYSFSLRPFLIAICRSATLCALEPVK